jgi:hypothetical protein
VAEYVPKAGDRVVVILRGYADGQGPDLGEEVTVASVHVTPKHWVKVLRERGCRHVLRFIGWPPTNSTLSLWACTVIPPGGPEEAAWRLGG